MRFWPKRQSVDNWHVANYSQCMGFKQRLVKVNYRSMTSKILRNSVKIKPTMENVDLNVFYLIFEWRNNLKIYDAVQNDL